MIAGISLGLVPGAVELLVECVHADEDQESPDHFCGGHCPDCSPQAQALPVASEHSVADLTLSHEIHVSTLETMALPDGFASRLDRPPAA